MTTRPPEKKKNKEKPGVDESSLERAALRYLQRYSSSIKNLERVLDRRLWRAELDTEALVQARKVRDVVVERMVEADLLDDTLYSRLLAVSLHQEGKSGAVIKQRLQQKGIADTEIENALSRLAALTPHPEERAAWNLARRRGLGPFRSDRARGNLFPSSGNLQTESEQAAAETEPKQGLELDRNVLVKRRQRELGVMARAGFSFALASRILDSPLEDAPPG